MYYRYKKMETNLDPGVMENALEVIRGGINQHLSPDTLKSLAIASTRTHQAVKKDVQDALFWKTKLEDLLNLDLTWRGSAEYWRTMYDKYKSTPSYKLYETGRYEYVYIANRLNEEGDLQSAIHGATVLEDIKSLELLFEEPNAKIHDILSPIIYAVEKQSDLVVETLLRLSQNNSINEVSPYGSSVFEVAAHTGRVDYMKMINDKYPVVEALHTTRNVFKASTLFDLDNRADVMKYFLSLKLECPYDIDNYIQRHYGYTIPENEIRIMLESECVNLNSEYLTYHISPEAGLYLYTNRESPLHRHSKLIWLFVTQDSGILRDALSYHIPEDIMTNIPAALRSNSDSFEIITEYATISKEEQLSLLAQHIDEIVTIPLQYIYYNTEISDRELETLVFNNSKQMREMSIKALHSVGCPFDRIGQMLVFHVSYGIPTMVEGGLSLDRIGPIVIKNALINQKHQGIIKDVLKGMKTIDMSRRYLYLAKTNGDKHFLKTHGLMNQRGISASATTILDNDVDWYSPEYSWVDNIRPSSVQYITYGITQMRDILQIQIIGRVAPATDNVNLGLWLKLATGLKVNVKVSVDNTDILIMIGDITVTLPSEALKTKYRGLDLFSLDGTPLTTVEQIRKRRIAIFR